MAENLLNYPLLAEKTLNGTLTKDELVSLTRTLQARPKLVLEWGLTAEQFPSLVKSYPDVAVQLLVALENTALQAKFYQTLFGLQLTNELAALIVRVQNAVDVPLLQYEHFVNSAMDDCMKVDEDEKLDGSKKVGQVRILLRIILNYIAKAPEFLSLVQQDTLDKVSLNS
eukprot:TRINITY_DN1840_c0_g1_i15.p1 TRINITY_DN1840_c0_g1~~TRINITY_DN1840_c0_g1_i15.p1  ORF type:complete len:170 (-),score=56.09 TRINITY_DN1840_c0_g1_i15:208-717(-)